MRTVHSEWIDLFKAKDGDKTNHELRIVEVEFKENLNR